MRRRTTGEIPDGTEYHEEPLSSKDQTGRRMYAIVDQFYGDLRTATTDAGTPMSRLSMPAFFNFVKDIPYRRDEKPVEVLARPAHILKFARLGMDCKKKNSLMAAWCRAQNPPVPYRFIASSSRDDKRVHHVFCQAMIDGKWTTMDPTYAWYKPGEVKEVTHAEVLSE